MALPTDQMAELWALEHSTLKVPYEVLNKKFRMTQKALDRDATRIGDCLNEIEKLLRNPVVNANDLNPWTVQLEEKLRALQEKLHDNVQQEVQAMDAINTRIDHLKIGVGSVSSDCKEKQCWRQTRIERILVDYLLRSGYYDIAAAVAERCNIAHLTNMAIFAHARLVEDSLKRHETGPCLDWCYENRSRLRRLKSTLELKVRQQDFIELVRMGDKLAAVRYATKHFGSVELASWGQLMPILGLLAFHPASNCERYKSLMSGDRWDELVEVFRCENLRLYQLGVYSVFSTCLQCGISAIKTPRCMLGNYDPYPVVSFPQPSPTHGSEDSQENALRQSRLAQQQLQQQCPTCTDEVRLLSEHLPVAHVSQSRLICPYSGEPLNENNPPFVLPNGFVYGQSSLLAIATQNGGKMVCPRTRQSFSLKEADRVYIL
ncbi:Macrophage erythroblast attacher [Trichinella nelsoni]|uniref:E3 ubiquitin-protein transferase MAEA n=1 Tax=Trichinella nelsoni TaxID=6336 RepID=A0A0V0RUM1_9BILA|nr:Macrophage erythroblast attacher [Trichinella nelsoni]